jgi:Mrp family chromosome partitioning ATPase
MAFRKATKRQAKLRLAHIGPSGSGKTYTALTLATDLAPDGRVALLDTERGSARKYAAGASVTPPRRGPEESSGRTSLCRLCRYFSQCR